MRRVLLIGLIIVAGIVTTAGLYFSVRTVYLDEAKIDLTEPPEQIKCENQAVISVDANNIVRIGDNTIAETDIENALNSIAAPITDKCLLIRVSEMSDSRFLIRIKDYSDKIGLRSHLVILSE